MKINLGAGTDIRDGYINHDIAPLTSIDVVHDLNIFPYPWEGGSIDEIIARDVIEHLDDFMKVMEEIYRILKPGGLIKIKVPYWNSVSRHADPTHKRGFHELTFRFFDPASIYCQERHYYTHARFHINEECFILVPFSPYLAIPGLGVVRVKGKFAKRVVGLIGNMFSNIILDLDLILEKPLLEQIK
jgi:SAM-dependent methyltransferase